MSPNGDIMSSAPRHTDPDVQGSSSRSPVQHLHASEHPPSEIIQRSKNFRATPGAVTAAASRFHQAPGRGQRVQVAMRIGGVDTKFPRHQHRIDHRVADQQIGHPSKPPNRTAR